MDTDKAIKMIRENPELVFTCKLNHRIYTMKLGEKLRGWQPEMDKCIIGAQIINVTYADVLKGVTTGSGQTHMILTDKWEVDCPSVSWQEALENWAGGQGRPIECMVNDKRHCFGTASDEQTFTKKMIEDGVWYLL